MLDTFSLLLSVLTIVLVTTLIVSIYLCKGKGDLAEKRREEEEEEKEKRRNSNERKEQEKVGMKR